MDLFLDLSTKAGGLTVEELEKKHTSLWHIDGNVEKENDPSLGISNRLDGWLSLPRLAKYSYLILRLPSNSVVLLLDTEKPSIHGGIREVENGKK
jgi:hypothetical protein